jgi:glycosyltransferase involved in cell wall biosynthesis
LLTTDLVGGVWDFCVTLASGLRAQGDDVALLALGSPTAAHRQAAQDARARLVSAPLKLEWMANSEADVEITGALVAQLAQDVGAELIHANQFAAALAPVDIPVVLTIHSDVLSWRRWTLGDSSLPAEWRAYAALASQAAARADTVVAVSAFLAHEVTELYSVERPIRVVHNGWPAPAREAGGRTRSTVVAGRLWDAAKNVVLVAQAAQGWEAGPVYLAGDSEHPDGGRMAIPEPLQPLGFLARDELDALLSRSRVYVSAARYDPFGLLPLQAALHGCSLVLSDIPSYREVWGNTASYFHCDDPDDLRRVWQRVLETPADGVACSFARECLSVEHMVETYRAIYAERALAAA